MVRRKPDQYDFAKQLFDELLLPTSGPRNRSRFPRRGKISHIDIHHMTVKDSNNGQANHKCVDIWKTREASAHYGIDNDHVAQFVYDNREAWGNGNTWANQTGIIIEHANSKLAPTWEISDKTIATSVKLVANLHVKYKLGRPTSKGFGTGGTIRTHQSLSDKGTACPGPYFKKIWSDYVKRVQAEYDRLTKTATTPAKPVPAKPTPAPKPKKVVFWLGDWNLTSPSYSDSPGVWSKRGPKIAKAIRDSKRMGGCSLYTLHEVTTSAMTVTLKKAFGSKWRHGGSAIGNDSYEDSTKFKRNFRREHTGTFGGQRRGMSQSELVRDGKRFNLIEVHAPNGTNAKAKAAKTAYAKWVVAKIKNFKDPTIVVGDYNHEKDYDGSLGGELAKAGFKVHDHNNAIDKIAVKGCVVTTVKVGINDKNLSTHPGYQYRIEI